MLKKFRLILAQIKPLNILFLTIAGIVNAVGITLFLTPVKLYDSGISGTSMLLSQVTPLSLSLCLLILNIPLFLYGLKRQGGLFTFYAIYTVSIYSLVAFLITDVLPIDVSIASPLAENDLLLCALFGGMISGVGSGLAIRFGGAMDGIEVMSVIFARRLGISVGTFVMIYNVILYICCGIAMKGWIIPLYSIVTYMAGLKTLDFIVEGLDRSKAATIITTRAPEITKALTEAFGSGITEVDAKGGFSGKEKAMLYFVVNRFQIRRMKEIVQTIDPGSFITVSDVADVYTSVKGN